MYLSNLGGQSRKTGIRPKTNLKTDKYGMEDVDDFFEDDDDDGINKLKGQKLTIALLRGEEVSNYKSTISQPFNNIARKSISIKKMTKHLIYHQLHLHQLR